MNKCPYPYCRSKVSSSRFACWNHWKLLPKYSQINIGAAIKRSDGDLLELASKTANRFFNDHYTQSKVS